MGKSIDPPPTDDELPLLARDITYEFAMATYAANILLALASPRGEGDLGWSGWVEVLLLHSRVLTDFFHGGPNGDDVVAIHYDPNWNRDSEDVAWLQAHVPEINKRVMHLTAYRARRNNDGRDVGETLARLTDLMRAFLTDLPEERRSWFPIAFGDGDRTD